MLKNNQSFCLGLSKPINFFNKADIELLKFAIMNQFMLHVSITYPVNAFIFRNIFLKKEIEDTKLIAKILGEDIRLFEKTFKSTLKKFSIKKIHIAQLVNLPIKKNSERNVNSLINEEYLLLVKKFKEYKSKNLINKMYLQIFSNDSLPFIKKVANDFDGFIFYANIDSIFLKKEVYEYIKKNNIPCALLSSFGGGKIIVENLQLQTLMFAYKIFGDHSISIGRTNNINRLFQIRDILQNSKNNQSYSKKLIFKSNNENQENSSIFIKESRFSGSIYSLKYLLKEFIKNIFKK